MKLPKHYDPKESEKKWQTYWEKNKIYKFNPNSKAEVYSIDTPPPYASAGHLHVGHALSYTQFEMVARIMRQSGKNVYFAPGFDNNGLPTEKYVEEKFNIDKSKTNRADFRKLCRKESAKVEKIYADKVFKALGHSYDWDLLYTTIDPEAQKISQTSFLKLTKQGDCYRKEEPVIWCPYHQTALAQAEVEDLNRHTKLNYIDFDVSNSNEKITIATTRPEFIPACVGIFVHPEDRRYKHLIGKDIVIPIFKYKVKVLKDITVDKEFGTGIMMVCTFGDTADIEKWKKHKLKLRAILNEDGTLNKLTKDYQGLKANEAREKILHELRAEDRLKKQEDLAQTVGSCWRCNRPVEYILTKQWFIKTLDYKKQLIQQGRKVKWHPDFMRVRYENWVKNLGWDWIISRQRYYGIPIPVWYCSKCDETILPEEKDLPLDPTEHKKKCPKCKTQAVADEDVFDTWMTSSNSPELALRWLEKPSQYKKIAPMSLRPQSHDIIRTWAFYTILKSSLLFKRIPWKDIIINTFVLDEKGKGMSKSKGNVVWADELLEKYGVDSFRYWMSTASLGSDLPFQEKDMVAGNKLINKLWNASKFAIMNLEDYTPKKTKLEPFDSWFLSKLNSSLEDSLESYLKYDISNARKKIENLFWTLFCDNYLEIIKNRLYNGKKTEKASAQYVLYQSLLTILKLFAPIMPHLTEELYQLYFKKHEKTKSIHITEWTKLDPKLINKKLEQEGNALVEIISKVRYFKTSKQKSLREEIFLTLPTKFKNSAFLPDIKSVTNAKEIKFGTKLNISF